MIKTNNWIARLFAAAFAIAAVAVTLRAAELNVGFPFLNKLFVFLRTFFYISIFSMWGFSVNGRIMQTQARRFLACVSVLAVFWIAVREIKYRFVLSPVIIRYLWYSYYVPLLFVPLFALFVALSLGKAEDFRLPKKAALLYIPALCLLGLVLTNDFHKLAFVFPEGSAVWNDINYSYGFVFYLCVLWSALCALCALGAMLSKSRLPNSKRLIWAALIPFAAALAYVVIYSLRLPFVMKYLGDVAVVNCLFYMCFLEICIQCGFIQSNSRYNSLFRASEDLPVQITDRAFNPVFSSKSFEGFSRESLEKATHESIIIDGKTRLSTIPVDGGFAASAEDISAFMLAKERLAAVSEELTERNLLLQYELEKEQEHRKIEEQNKLYDLLQNSAQSRLNKIDLLVKEYQQETDEKKKTQLLAQIAVIGSYIKRRKDFVLSSYGTSKLSPAMLESAFAESFRALSLLGIKGAGYVEADESLTDAELLTRAYDFFETVAECVLSRAKYISASFSRINGTPRISVCTDCELGLLPLQLSGFESAEIISEDGTRFILPFEKEAEI